MTSFARVTLTLHKGEGLVALNPGGTSNPFVTVTIGKYSFSSPVIEKTCNPNFADTTFEFPCCPLPTIVTLKVYNKLTFSDLSDSMGTSTITLFGATGTTRRSVPLGHGGDVSLATKARMGCGTLDISYAITTLSSEEVEAINKQEAAASNPSPSTTTPELPAAAQPPASTGNPAQPVPAPTLKIHLGAPLQSSTSLVGSSVISPPMAALSPYPSGPMSNTPTVIPTPVVAAPPVPITSFSPLLPSTTPAVPATPSVAPNPVSNSGSGVVRTSGSGIPIPSPTHSITPTTVNSSGSSVPVPQSVGPLGQSMRTSVSLASIPGVPSAAVQSPVAVPTPSPVAAPIAAPQTALFPTPSVVVPSSLPTVPAPVQQQQPPPSTPLAVQQQQHRSSTSASSTAKSTSNTFSSSSGSPSGSSSTSKTSRRTSRSRTGSSTSSATGTATSSQTRVSRLESTQVAQDALVQGAATREFDVNAPATLSPPPPLSAAPSVAQDGKAPEAEKEKQVGSSSVQPKAGAASENGQTRSMSGARARNASAGGGSAPRSRAVRSSSSSAYGRAGSAERRGVCAPLSTASKRADPFAARSGGEGRSMEGAAAQFYAHPDILFAALARASYGYGNHGQTPPYAYASPMNPYVQLFERLRQVDPLLSRGFDKVRDCSGRSLLHMAAWYGNIEILKTLISPNPVAPVVNFAAHVTKNGNTILHCAAQGGQAAMCEWILFQPGMEKLQQCKNKRGLMPYECALEARFPHVSNLIGGGTTMN